MRASVSEHSEGVVTEKEKQEMFDYMAELGKTFDDLINSLRLCVDLLVSFKPLMPDANAWQEMVDMLEQKISLGERVKQKRWVH